MKNWRDNVSFVLVEPEEPGNIGASARAIKNMGFRDLCLVSPPHPVPDEARWMAHNALDVLESAKICDSVADAVRDKSLVVGTSRRIGRKRGMFLHADQGAERIAATASVNRVAVLFGREDRGLYNEEIDECGFLMTIPSSKKQPSLNLSQAVMIVAYELSKAGYAMAAPDRREQMFSPAKLVGQRDLSGLYSRIEEMLVLLEYMPKGNLDLSRKVMQNLKHCIGRAGLTDWELKMFHGIVSRIEKKLK